MDNLHAVFIQLYICASCGGNVDLTLLGYFSPLQINSTPLHVACENRHYDIVAVLLSYNADGTKKDHVRSTHTHAHAHTTQHTHTHTHTCTHISIVMSALEQCRGWKIQDLRKDKWLILMFFRLHG